MRYTADLLLAQHLFSFSFSLSLIFVVMIYALINEVLFDIKMQGYIKTLETGRLGFYTQLCVLLPWAINLTWDHISAAHLLIKYNMASQHDLGS